MRKKKLIRKKTYQGSRRNVCLKPSFSLSSPSALLPSFDVVIGTIHGGGGGGG